MTGELDDPSISSDSVVVRRVALSEHIFDETIGRRRPSSQAFMQSGRDGLVSVYLLSETTYEAVAQAGSQRYLATVTVGILVKMVSASYAPRETVFPDIVTSSVAKPEVA